MELNECMYIISCTSLAYLEIFLQHIKTKRFCSFFNLVDYLIGRAFWCEPYFSFKPL